MVRLPSWGCTSMSVISKLAALAAAGGGGLPDATIGALLAENSDPTSAGRATQIIATDDASKFLMFYYNNQSDYFRAAVVTVSSGNVSIGSFSNVVYNRNWSDSENPGWIWDSNAGGAIGVVVDDSSDQIKACRVTYSGTSISSNVSSSMESANNYRPPYGKGAACFYSPLDNCYLAVYGNGYNVYVKPFTVSGSNFSLGSRQGTGISTYGRFIMTGYYKQDTRDLFIACMGYNGGSGYYWNTISGSRYNGGTNGSFNNTFNGNNYNSMQNRTHEPAVVYNPEENVLWLTSRAPNSVSSSEHTRVFACTPNSNGSLSIGSYSYWNPSALTTLPTSPYSASRGGFYDPSSQAVIWDVYTSQYNSTFFQTRGSGTSMSEMTNIGSLFNMYEVPANAAAYDTVNSRTMFAYGNGKDPYAFPSNWVSIRNVTP